MRRSRRARTCSWVRRPRRARGTAARGSSLSTGAAPPPRARAPRRALAKHPKTLTHRARALGPRALSLCVSPAPAVIDCHQDWCGPCETLAPLFNSIYMDTQDAETRLMLCTANIPLLKEKLTAFLPSVDNDIDLAKHGCMPFFLIVRFKQCVKVVVGANAPLVKESIASNMPDIPSADDEE